MRILNIKILNLPPYSFLFCDPLLRAYLSYNPPSTYNPPFPYNSPSFHFIKYIKIGMEHLNKF